MINLIGLSNVIKPAKTTQNNSNAFRLAMSSLKADTFERSNPAENKLNVTCPISFTGKSNRLKEYKKVTDALNQTAQNAQTALDGQLASDGWAGKVADSISVLWNSKNRSTLVQADIDSYKEQVNSLENSIKNDKFNEAFKEMFDIEFNHANVVRYKKKSEQLTSAVSADTTAKIIESKLSDSLKTYNKLSGKLSDITERKYLPTVMTGCVSYYDQVTTKEEIFENMENSLADVLGDKKVLKSVLSAGGMDVEKASNEEKYKAYGFIANFLVESSKETAKECAKGQTLEQIKADYDKAYEKAYGTKNNIQNRVDKYCRSQEIGAAAVRGVTRSALAILTTLMNPPTGMAKIAINSAMTFGIKVAVDGSDKLTNDIDNSIDFNSKVVKKLVRSAAISAAEKFATGSANMFIPKFDTGNATLDFALNQGRNVLIDTTCGMTSEKLKQGNWAKNQILPRMIISAVFRNLKPDNDFVDELLSMTKGGVNQAMKKSTRSYEYVKAFVTGTRQVLEENYKRDNQTFADLKKLADENPEKYEKLMTEMLQAEIDERAEEGKKEVK